MTTGLATNFPILGRAFEGIGLPSRLELWLRNQWEFAGEAPSHRYTIRVEFIPQKQAPSAPRHAERCNASMPGALLDCVGGDDQWWFGNGRVGVHLALVEGGARLQLWTDDSVPVGRLLYLAIAEAVRDSGLVPIHGAVAVRDEAATAFLAVSGTGKSSTLLQAVRAGWTAIAEDFSWLDPATLTIHGWDRGIHLWPEGRSRFARDFPDDLWTPGPDGKLFLPFTALGSERLNSATLSRIALLERRPDRPSGWEPLGQREAVRALWEAQGVSLSPAAVARASHLVPDLLDRLELARLILGTTVLPL